jgi:hypothetical protein
MHALLLVLTLSLYAGVPGLQGADRGPRAHLEKGCEPAGEANFLAPHSIILSFYSAVDDGPREVPELEVRERPPSMLRNIDSGPLGGAGAGGSEVRDVDGGPHGGAGGKVRQRLPPKLKTSTEGLREVPELEIRERSAFGARSSGRAVNGCRNLGQMIKE